MSKAALIKAAVNAVKGTAKAARSVSQSKFGQGVKSEAKGTAGGLGTWAAGEVVNQKTKRSDAEKGAATVGGAAAQFLGGSAKSRAIKTAAAMVAASEITRRVGNKKAARNDAKGNTFERTYKTGPKAGKTETVTRQPK